MPLDPANCKWCYSEPERYGLGSFPESPGTGLGFSTCPGCFEHAPKGEPIPHKDDCERKDES